MVVDVGKTWRIWSWSCEKFFSTGEGRTDGNVKKKNRRIYSYQNFKPLLFFNIIDMFSLCFIDSNGFYDWIFLHLGLGFHACEFSLFLSRNGKFSL
jgi:hypothetical protein